ncbi:hypothetical protein N8D56_14980 [Devosia sp. A8/3-2]|nr:hypothetical protein N8D56_14980 [Devosia sp. A8/3-2]
MRVAHLGQAVYTGAITANYYRDAVNMTTKKGYANTVPCIVQSADQIMAGEPAEVTGLLRQLKNREIFNYAMVSARTEGLKPHSWADFDADSDPLRFFMLRALSNPVGSAVARACTSRGRCCAGVRVLAHGSAFARSGDWSAFGRSGPRAVG